MAWLPKRRVIVPIDFSELSPGAIATALEFVLYPADLHVIHVLMASTDRDLLGEWAPRRSGETWDDAARKFLANYLQEHGFSAVTPVVRLGDPGLTITDYAREQRPS